jgi:hypothetical protein
VLFRIGYEPARIKLTGFVYDGWQALWKKKPKEVPFPFIVQPIALPALNIRMIWFRKQSFINPFPKH